MGDELPLITPFTACRYLYAFRRYSQSVESFPTSHQTLDIFRLPKFKGGGAPQKLYLCYHRNLKARHVATGKVSWGYTHYPLSYRHALAEN